MQRLTTSAVAPYRAQLLAKQAGKCALCKRACASRTPCLDHCHTSGVVRGVLCRGCNAQLGKIENNLPRNGLTDIVALANYFQNIIPYLESGKRGGTGILHPTHKTDDEKRLKRNADARKRRAAPVKKAPVKKAIKPIINSNGQDTARYPLHDGLDVM